MRLTLYVNLFKKILASIEDSFIFLIETSYKL